MGRRSESRGCERRLLENTRVDGEVFDCRGVVRCVVAVVVGEHVFEICETDWRSGRLRVREEGTILGRRDRGPWNVTRHESRWVEIGRRRVG